MKNISNNIFIIFRSFYFLIIPLKLVQGYQNNIIVGQGPVDPIFDFHRKLDQ